MTPSETTLLIAAAGGDAKFAALLGIHEKPGCNQRVNNWKRRGMPAAVERDHYEKVQVLRALAVDQRESA